jgi:hypothetical protein
MGSTGRESIGEMSAVFHPYPLELETYRALSQECGLTCDLTPIILTGKSNRLRINAQRYAGAVTSVGDQDASS